MKECALLKNREEIFKRIRTDILTEQIFSLTEENFKEESLDKIFNKLLENDIEYNFSTLRIKVLPDLKKRMEMFGFAAPMLNAVMIDEMQEFNNLSLKQAFILMAVYHEIEHFAQLQRMVKENNDYNTILQIEDGCMNACAKVDYSFSLLELDARYGCINRLFKDISKNNIPQNFESYLVIARECFCYLTASMGIKPKESKDIKEPLDTDCSYLSVYYRNFVQQTNKLFNENNYIRPDRLQPQLEQQSSDILAINNICEKNIAVYLKQLPNLKYKLGIDDNFIKDLYNNKLQINQLCEFYSNLFNKIFIKKSTEQNYKNINIQDKEF